MFESFWQLDFTDIWCWIVFPAFPLVGWGIYLFLLGTGRNPLALSNRVEVPWGLIDTVMMFGSMMAAKFVGQIVGMSLISQRINQPLSKITTEVAFQNGDLLMASNVVFSVVQLVLVVAWIRFWQKASWSDLGLHWGQIRRHLAIGVVASILLIPPILVLNVYLHWLLEMEYSHRVITLVQYAATLTAVSTVLLTPWLEELHFRVIVQGWLERITSLDLAKKIRLVHGDYRSQSLIGELTTDSKKTSRKKSVARADADAGRVPIWPIFLSSLIFAGMHSGQGAGPYTLFVFAVGLGYLYRQTHSLIPCVVVHLILNLWSFIALVTSLSID